MRNEEEIRKKLENLTQKIERKYRDKSWFSRIEKCNCVITKKALKWVLDEDE